MGLGSSKDITKYDYKDVINIITHSEEYKKNNWRKSKNKNYTTFWKDYNTNLFATIIAEYWPLKEANGNLIVDHYYYCMGDNNQRYCYDANTDEWSQPPPKNLEKFMDEWKKLLESARQTELNKDNQSSLTSTATNQLGGLPADANQGDDTTYEDDDTNYQDDEDRDYEGDDGDYADDNNDYEGEDNYATPEDFAKDAQDRDQLDAFGRLKVRTYVDNEPDLHTVDYRDKEDDITTEGLMAQSSSNDSVNTGAQYGGASIDYNLTISENKEIAITELTDNLTNATDDTMLIITSEYSDSVLDDEIRSNIMMTNQLDNVKRIVFESWNSKKFKYEGDLITPTIFIRDDKLILSVKIPASGFLLNICHISNNNMDQLKNFMYEHHILWKN